MKGQCSCGEVQFDMLETPLFVHACHCKNCQRQSGSAHALNAMIETSKVNVLSGKSEGFDVPTDSGRRQTIFRCPSCKVALWSTYGGAGDAFLFGRVGSLDDPATCPPDINIFTKSKQLWVTLYADIPAVEEFYDAKEYWPAETLERMQASMDAAAK